MRSYPKRLVRSEALAEILRKISRSPAGGSGTAGKFEAKGSTTLVTFFTVNF
jgi:hypothetical protein